MGIERSQITKDMLLIPGDSAIKLIDNFEEIEEEATMFEHNLMVALGQVEAPEDDEKEQNYLLHATYCLAAAMVAADGKIESEEIAVAEAIGKGLFQDFDPVDFRERCNQTLNRWFGGANRPAETNAQDRCQSAERRVSVPGNSLVYPRRTPEFSQLDATIEWWRLWPKRSGGPGRSRAHQRNQRLRSSNPLKPGH